MLAKIRLTLSVFGLLGILAACSTGSSVGVATSPSSTTVTQDLVPTSTLTAISTAPQGTAGMQTGLPSLRFDCQNIREIPVEECQALVALYRSTDGDNWEDHSGWLVDHTPCTWYGVICKQGHVIELQLFYNQLTGPLPSEIGNLTYLENLYLDRNQLSGPLPQEIGNLGKLQLARLGGNQFSSIPAEIGKLDSLVYLELWNNQLGGKIPGQLGNLSNLQELKLSFNQFTGSIPPELGDLANLNQLDLSHNRLSGSIPTALAGLTNLNQLDLSFNQLTGSIPTKLEGLTDLYWLDLSYNHLTGVVPVALVKAPISELRLWGNLLDGTVLASQGTMTIVEYRGVHFEFNSVLAGSVWPDIGAAQPPSEGAPAWEVRPEHVRFTFASQDKPDYFQVGMGPSGHPQILIYPTQTFSRMSEVAGGRIEELRALLEARPPIAENEIPLLPRINAAQVFHVQVKYLDFQNGSGVRFITHYSQDVSPITNQNIFYTFQGLTDDGAYYVAAYFPIAATGLSNKPGVEDPETFNAQYQDYLAETIGYLNGLTSHELEPDLGLLDNLIQSLVVDPP
jgi:hypothetical protein